MKRINIALALLLISSPVFGSHGGGVDLNVSKVVVLSGEDGDFRDKIHVPCCNGCIEACVPGDMNAAVDFLLRGFDAEILKNSVGALKSACKEIGRTCSPRSEDLWSRFSTLAKLIVVEPEHSLDEYLSGVNYSIAEAWGIKRACAESDDLCQWFRHRVRASPYMLSEMIVRGALLKASEISFKFHDIVVSMGDLVSLESHAVPD